MESMWLFQLLVMLECLISDPLELSLIISYDDAKMELRIKFEQPSDFAVWLEVGE